MKSKSLWLFLLTLLLLAIVPPSCTKIIKNGGNGLDQIDPKDLRVLEAFFEILIKHEDCGFTLFGKKPISFAEYLLPEERAAIGKWTVFPHLLEEGWKAFQKYPQVFDSSKFSLKRSINSADPLPVVYLTLINKKAALEVIEAHIDLFRETHGPKFNPKSYLESLEEAAWEEPKLAGILVGYGSMSAWAFHRIREIPLYYEAHPEVLERELAQLTEESKKANSDYIEIRIKGLAPDELKPSFDFPSIAEELNYITEHYSYFELDGTDFTCSPFSSMGFRCLDNDEEVTRLQKSYQETLDVLTKSYQNRPFLEVTLEQWRKE